MRLALVLLGLNYLLGWPAVAVSASMSPWIGAEASAFMGAGFYGFSWLLLGGAVWLGGRDIVQIGRERFFNR
jgi:hypothetical protein